MSLPYETMLELMALVDGELEGEAKARAESLASRDEEARRVVEALRASGVRAWLSETVEQTRAADGVADQVMAKLEERPGPMSIGRARRVSRVMKVQAIVASTLAIAAAAAIYARSGHRGNTPAPVASVHAPNPVTLAKSVEVDEIDTVANVSIFEISPSGNSPTRSSVVVWIDDETEDN
jgi:anti-sigma factor RsiW